MRACELPITATSVKLHASAAAGERVRLCGTVEACGEGYSGKFRQRWLHVRTPAGLVRVTASRTSPLGTACVGTAVEFAARLTGLVDLTQQLYYAERAQVIRIGEAG